jgi:hypothetical protein
MLLRQRIVFIGVYRKTFFVDHQFVVNDWQISWNNAGGGRGEETTVRHKYTITGMYLRRISHPLPQELKLSISKSTVPATDEAMSRFTCTLACSFSILLQP